MATTHADDHGGHAHDDHEHEHHHHASCSFEEEVLDFRRRRTSSSGRRTRARSRTSSGTTTRACATSRPTSATGSRGSGSARSRPDEHDGDRDLRREDARGVPRRHARLRRSGRPRPARRLFLRRGPDDGAVHPVPGCDVRRPKATAPAATWTSRPRTTGPTSWTSTSRTTHGAHTHPSTRARCRRRENWLPFPIEAGEKDPDGAA